MFKYVYNQVKYSLWCSPEYEEILDKNINNSEIFIVGLSWCPWTRRSIELIKNENLESPRLITPDIISNEYKVKMLYCLSKKVNTINVPQIWINGEHIGNFEQLYKMKHRGQLEQLKAKNI